jgi:hypothetical protein
MMEPFKDPIYVTRPYLATIEEFAAGRYGMFRKRREPSSGSGHQRTGSSKEASGREIAGSGITS